MSAWPAPPAATLSGRVVRLEALATHHGDGLFAAARPAEIWTWMPVRAIGEDRTAFDEWLRGALDASAAGDEVAFATIDAVTGAVLGSTRFLALRPAHRSLEIGWTWLTPSAWGTGANVEAKLLQMTHAFETLGCRRVELKTDARNARSRAAMERLGASFEGVHRKHTVRPDGGARDSAWYSVIDDEWPAVRAGLRARVDAHGGGGPPSTSRLAG